MMLSSTMVLARTGFVTVPASKKLPAAVPGMVLPGERVAGAVRRVDLRGERGRHRIESPAQVTGSRC